MDVTLPGVRNAAFLLAEANGERSRALFEIPDASGPLAAGTILKADGAPLLLAADVATAAAILYGAVDATDAAQKAAVIAKDAEVHGELLAWPEAFVDADKLAVADALENKGIIVRWTERPVGLTTDEPLSDG
jgi:hypothetical protein